MSLNFCVINILIINFSIDDTIDIFEDLTENGDNYDTIFKNNTLFFQKNYMTNIMLNLLCMYLMKKEFYFR